ncbi:metal-dependent hydrolase [Bacillus phage SP-10]|uniref:metal-dependent hydrolase n=1 Tax=Bacillus phage SP10 TaxID=941058 RepID=UPI0002198BAD|nr:metal-dependent hydrolase [Bacillus phage SP-10]BAK53029.1 metal-dependent hydrolase [Bacillus phage SP-10]
MSQTLQFLGCGSAFNTKLGNNSAFVKRGNTLILFDCGSTVFSRLKESGLLEGTEEIHVLLTHTHPDHFGSLGDLILYNYYAMEPVTTRQVIIYCGGTYTLVGKLLKGMGIPRSAYALKDSLGGASYYGKDVEFKLYPVSTEHVDELDCYGYSFHIDGKKIYYSGDASKIPVNQLSALKNKEYDEFYQDTCSVLYDGNVHMSLTELHRQIPREVRSRVYCMHLDEKFDPEKAKQYGFNVVEPVNFEKSNKTSKAVENPPLGVTPRWLHDELRFKELSEAIDRFREACKPIPEVWVNEYNSYLKKYVVKDGGFVHDKQA